MTSFRLMAGVLTTTLVIAGSLYLTSVYAPSAMHSMTSLSATELTSFYLLVICIYALSAILWKTIAHHAHTHRSLSDAILDTGLIALGKYIPGKLVGIVFRGSVNDNALQISRQSVSVSLMEQLYSLGIGVLFFLALMSVSVSGLDTNTRGLLCLLLLAAAITLHPILRRVVGTLSKTPAMKPLPVLKHLFLISGYCCLWLVTALPFIVIIGSTLPVTLAGIIPLMAQFCGAMIAGWVAVFAPGGIGVREGVFVALSSHVMPWETGVYFMAMHRALYSLFDLVYGILSVSILYGRIWRQKHS